MLLTYLPPGTDRTHDLRFRKTLPSVDLKLWRTYTFASNDMVLGLSKSEPKRTTQNVHPTFTNLFRMAKSVTGHSKEESETHLGLVALHLRSPQCAHSFQQAVDPSQG